MDRLTDDRDGRTYTWCRVDSYADIQLPSSRTDGHTDVQTFIHRQADKKIDTQTDGRIDGKIARQDDGQIDRQILINRRDSVIGRHILL